MSDPLREYVRLMLEAAQSAAAAASQGFALMRIDRGNEVVLVMYDPSSLEPGLETATEDDLYDLMGERLQAIVVGYVVGVKHPNDCRGAVEIKNSAAKKGYGPLMYELMMGESPAGIASDRKSTSPAARRVWDTYASRSDVETLPFDDKRNPKTPPKEDDCQLVNEPGAESLDNAYRGGGASGAQLERNHEDFLKRAESTGHSRQKVEAILSRLGDYYFGERLAG